MSGGADYAFYRDQWGGGMPEEEFAFFGPAAQAWLDRYKRMYQVTEAAEEGEAKAVCAMADALRYFEKAENGQAVQSVQLGSLQVERAEGTMPEVSARAKSRELFRCASLYLDIYRGPERGETACCG